MSEERTEQILSVFPDASTIVVCRGGEMLEFETPIHHITFEKLLKLSQIMGTKLIDIDRGTYSQGCESCGHGGSHTVTISVEGITK